MLKIIFLVCTFSLVIPLGAMAGGPKCNMPFCSGHKAKAHDGYCKHKHKCKKQSHTQVGRKCKMKCV